MFFENDTFAKETCCKDIIKTDVCLLSMYFRNTSCKSTYDNLVDDVRIRILLEHYVC